MLGEHFKILNPTSLTVLLSKYLNVIPTKINPSDSSQYASLLKLLEPCIDKRTLFRITYVEGLLDWEKESTVKSIALRVLYQFCKRRTKQEISYEKFADSFFGMALSLENVISVCVDCMIF